MTLFIEYAAVLVITNIFFRPVFLASTDDPCIVKYFEQVNNALKCKNIILDNLTVPAGVTLKLPLTNGANLVFRNNITFEFMHWDGPLVTINGSGISVTGETGSVIDGQGQLYWDGQGGWSNPKPQFFTVEVFGGSVFKDLYIVNTPKDVLQITNSDNVLIENWIINNSAGDPGKAPKGKEGHNTDGIDIWNSTNVVITNSSIYNQDDCIAVRCGANISVSNLYCHGGHGLSISVGFSNDSIPLNTVRNVSFTDCVVENSRNGIHIKTHVDGGFGNITGVIYQNIILGDINHNGILIEENYQNKPPKNYTTYVTDAEPRNNVPIRDLILKSITGSVQNNAIPVEIVCAEQGCFNWRWTNITLHGGKRNQCNFEPEGFHC